MIPKILFTYWEGDQLSELHYFTIWSLHKCNPDIDIIIYTDLYPTNILKQWNTNEHSVFINKKVTLNDIVHINTNKIKLNKIDFKKSYNINNNISVIYKADFTRIAKLWEHGGVWFDMDIFFTKPIPEFIFTNSIEMYLFTYSETIPTGFIACVPNCELIKRLYIESINIIKNHNNLNNYQSLGPNLWIKEYNQCSKKNIEILDNNYIYPFLWNNIDKLFTNTNESEISNINFGIHWYNGGVSTKHFINNFNKNDINPNRTLFEKIITKIL